MVIKSTLWSGNAISSLQPSHRYQCMPVYTPGASQNAILWLPYPAIHQSGALPPILRPFRDCLQTSASQILVKPTKSPKSEAGISLSNSEERIHISRRDSPQLQASKGYQTLEYLDEITTKQCPSSQYCGSSVCLQVHSTYPNQCSDISTIACSFLQTTM